MRGHKTVYIATMLVSLAVVIGGGFMLIRHFLTTEQPTSLEMPTASHMVEDVREVATPA